MITHGNEIKLFSGNSNRPLAEAIAKKLNTELGDIEVMINENHNLAIELAKKALSVADIDIVSSSVALRFLSRAELLNKDYDFEELNEKNI